MAQPEKRQQDYQSETFKKRVDERAFFARIDQPISHDLDAAAYLEAEKVEKELGQHAINLIGILDDVSKSTTVTDRIRARQLKGGKYNREMSEEELKVELKDLYLRHNPKPENNIPLKQSKKAPVEAQKIWKELVHEERLNKRLGRERLKLISVLSQILDKKQKEVPTPTPVEPEPAATASVIPLDVAVEDKGPKKPKKLDQINKSIKKHPLRTIAGVIGGSLAVAAIIFAARSCDSSQIPALETPTPSAAAGTPTPTPTQGPTETPAPEPTPVLISTPKPTETPSPTETPQPTATEKVVKIPNFGVRYNPSTGECVAVDRNTGKAVDISNSPIKRVNYQETGVGARKTISTTLKPGQTAIIQGWKVDGKGDGVFKAVVGDKEMEISFDISDGAVEVYGNQDAYLAFCRAVEIAVDKGYAHERVEIPEAWKITQ